MKKVTVLFVAFLLLFSLAVTPALAAEQGTAKIYVRNFTTGGVQLSVTDANGQTSNFNFPEPGRYDITLPEGRYSYYATSPCSVESGNLNADGVKILRFACEGLSYTKPNDSCVLGVWLEDPFFWWELNPDWFGFVIDEQEKLVSVRWLHLDPLRNL